MATPPNATGRTPQQNKVNLKTSLLICSWILFLHSHASYFRTTLRATTTTAHSTALLQTIQSLVTARAATTTAAAVAMIATTVAPSTALFQAFQSAMLAPKLRQYRTSTTTYGRLKLIVVINLPSKLIIK
jgi:hypothetical protein